MSAGEFTAYSNPVLTFNYGTAEEALRTYIGTEKDEGYALCVAPDGKQAVFPFEVSVSPITEEETLKKCPGRTMWVQVATVIDGERHASRLTVEDDSEACIWEGAQLMASRLGQIIYKHLAAVEE